MGLEAVRALLGASAGVNVGPGAGPELLEVAWVLLEAKAEFEGQAIR